MSVEVWMSAFRAPGGIPSGPAALPDLRDLIALVISVLLGGLVLISRSWVGGGMSGWAGGAGWLSVSLKCSAHLALCSSSPGMVFPFLSLTGRLGLLFSPTVPWLSRTVSSCFVGLLQSLPRWSASQCGFFCPSLYFSSPVCSSPSTGPVVCVFCLDLASG